jgi:hypothetical protein
MEVAAIPPVVVNWAGSETVSVEDYCTFMGELVNIKPIFEYTPEAHTPLWPDVTYMHEVLGRTKVHWRDGFRRMIVRGWAWPIDVQWELCNDSVGGVEITQLSDCTFCSLPRRRYRERDCCVERSI